MLFYIYSNFTLLCFCNMVIIFIIFMLFSAIEISKFFYKLEQLPYSGNWMFFYDRYCLLSSRKILMTIFFDLFDYVKLYTTVIYFYCFKFFLNNSNNFVFDNAFVVNFIENWIGVNTLNIYTCRLNDFNVFFKSTMLDKSVCLESIVYDKIFRCALPELYLPILHPEVSLHISENFTNAFSNYFGKSHIKFIEAKSFVSFINYINIFVNFIFMYYIVILLILFLFSFQTFSANNKNNIDSEQLASLILYESEKEVASIDDILPILIFLFFTFGIYFYFNVIQYSFVSFSSYVLTLFVLPIFFIFVFIIPLFLLYDFGFYCFVYLRGSGNTSLLSAELLYDFINLFAYYIRVVIQCARLILMLTAIGSYQELIYYLNFDFYISVFNDNFQYNNIYITKNSIFYIFFKSINLLIFFLYEIFHAYFVLTIQTIAFFAMVFWLFFYLFSFFVSEPFENYFERRRLIFNS